MQKTGPNHYLPNIAFKIEVNVTIGLWMGCMLQKLINGLYLTVGY